MNAIKAIYENTPYMNDFNTLLVSSALDVCNALFESLRFLLDNGSKHIVNAGISAHDTVYMFIQELENLDYNDPNFEYKIQQHELMIREPDSQESFIKHLKKRKSV